MGTLTAGQPRLDHYCRHKLPTSCRLSSIGECCACYDERAHSAAYSTYIDGLGFVSRGTRWQRYCWFCKEFWENRVSASGLRPGQTRIPHNPDQSEFLARWYEFHQGYRIVRKDDGSEERVAVLGEDLRDVAPGCLPRTLEELRAGRERGELEERERAARQQHHVGQEQEAVEPGPSLEDTLDEMFQAAAGEDSRAQEEHAVHRSRDNILAPSGNIHAQAMVPAAMRNRGYQARRVAALRRELHRMRSGIERVITGLRDLGENVPDHAEAASRLSELGRTLDTIEGDQAVVAINDAHPTTRSAPTTQSDRTLANIQARTHEARQHFNEARRNRDQAALELEVAEQEFQSSQSRLRQLQNEQRTTENYMRLFGTREEMAAQGENYESPIGGMFTRAYERFRVAEEVRREERTLRHVLEHEAHAGGEDAALRLAQLEAQDRDVWGVPNRGGQHSPESELRRITHMPYSRGSQPQAQGSELTSNTGADVLGLEEYHEMVEGNSEMSEEVRERNPQTENNTITDDTNQAARAEIIAADTEPLARTTLSSYVAGPPGQQLDLDPATDNDRGLDAQHVLTALAEDEALRSQLPQNPTARFIIHLLRRVENNDLGWGDREIIETMMEVDKVIWGSGLPAERNSRRRQRGERLTFSEDARQSAFAEIVVIHDVEMMAESFQMSGRVRDCSGLTAPEKLRMLFRLQRGERNPDDVEDLARMLRSDAAFSAAQEAHEQHDSDESITARLDVLDAGRREAARQGDHSREELDAQRRATRSFAIAAGRSAMLTGPAALLEQMASRDSATRSALDRMAENMSTPRLRHSLYRPLNMNDFTASPSATDSDQDSDDEAHGLDAKDSGRPAEPLTDEQMTVKLDCQICYSQVADVACLPCGHFVMCRWCSDQHSPTMAHDKTRPRRAANCPVCRKQIKQKVRVFRV